MNETGVIELDENSPRFIAPCSDGTFRVVNCLIYDLDNGKEAGYDLDEDELITNIHIRELGSLETVVRSGNGSFSHQLADMVHQARKLAKLANSDYFSLDDYGYMNVSEILLQHPGRYIFVIRPILYVKIPQDDVADEE